MHPPSPTSVATTALTLRYDQDAESLLAQLPPVASIMDSVTNVVCSPRVCGVKGDDMSSIKILRVSDTGGNLIDGGSNVCVTGDLHALTIISLVAVLTFSSDVFYYWTQEGCKDPTVPGRIKFTSRDGLLSMHFDLHQRDGLYYCSTDMFTVDHDPVRVVCDRTNTSQPLDISRPPSRFIPTSKARQVESEVWLLQFGSPGEHQLNLRVPSIPIN
jgi:hypothetical protein